MTARRRRIASLAALTLGVALTACRPDDSTPAPQAGAAGVEASGAEADYLAPPSILAASPGDGVIVLEGRATPGASVQLASPEGQQGQARADRGGAWTLTMPLGATPRLFALSAGVRGRALHADGALLLAPGALAPAVTLRAGAAALPLTPAALGRALDIATTDYDPSGFLAVGGHAPAGAAVTLSVDGTTAATGHADARGRYTLLAAGRRLAMGPHRLQAAAQGAAAYRLATLSPPGSLSTPYAVTRTPDGWRVEWALTGGGVQTTLLAAP